MTAGEREQHWSDRRAENQREVTASGDRINAAQQQQLRRLPFTRRRTQRSPDNYVASSIVCPASH